MARVMLRELRTELPNSTFGVLITQRGCEPISKDWGLNFFWRHLDMSMYNNVTEKRAFLNLKEKHIDVPSNTVLNWQASIDHIKLPVHQLGLLSHSSTQPPSSLQASVIHNTPAAQPTNHKPVSHCTNPSCTVHWAVCRYCINYTDASRPSRSPQLIKFENFEIQDGRCRHVEK